MIIKATRLQAWAPGGGGKSIGRRHPPHSKFKKKVFGYIGDLFATFSSYGGLFATFFLIFGGIFMMWGSFCYTFHFMVGAFFWASPPPTKISAGTHDCKEGSRAFSPEIFLCDRNLVSSGHVLLRFCLKNDKNNDKL